MNSKSQALLPRLGRSILASALALSGLTAVQVVQAAPATAAPQMIQMGDFTAAMLPTYPGQLAGDHTAVPNDSTISCVRTATVDATGATVAGGVLVGNNETSYLSHGTPEYGSCPAASTPADVTGQSSIGFKPMAPTEAPAGEPFLLGQVSHQNWVIYAQPKSGSGSNHLYGDLKVSFAGTEAGAQTDQFSWNLLETVNNAGVKYEQDASGNLLYQWVEWNGTEYVYSLKTTKQYSYQEPARLRKRDAQGNVLYSQWAYDYNWGWYVSGTATTPDPRSKTDSSFYDPVLADISNYVDDVTVFSDVRSIKIFTTTGGLPYRLVIRGFTPSDGTCPATPPENSVVKNEFITEEQAVTYGCLYASWEQERPMVLEKEAQKAAATAETTIPTFTYSQDPAAILGDLALTPTVFQPATGVPTNTQNGVDRTQNSMLVPLDGVKITENAPPADWKLTNVQCVQGPATQDPNDLSKFTPEPVKDWSDSATYPAVTRKDGAPITVDPATGLVDLSSVSMAASTENLAITCRYVNQYGPNEPVSVKKEAVDSDPSTPEIDPALVDADGNFTLTYKITVSNPMGIEQTYGPITDTPGLPTTTTVTSIKVTAPDGTVAYVANPANNTAFEVAPANSTIPGSTALPEPATLVYTVEIVGSVEEGFNNEIGECEAGSGGPGQGGYNAVTMPGDPDTTDNDDCIPIEDKPAFSVKKEAVDDQVVLAPGQTSVDVVYTVTVENTGRIPGDMPVVTEMPATPAGFSISKVTIDDVKVEAPYEIGSVRLLAGEIRSFTVVVTYTVDQSQVNWVEIGECETTGEGNPARGIYNVVSMPGDPDITDNDDCVPAFGTPTFAVAKAAVDEQVVLAPGQTSVDVVYTVTVENTGPVAGSSPQVIDTPAVPAGFSITEVKVGETVDTATVVTAAADGGYEVTSGVELESGASADFTVVVTYTVDQSKVTWVEIGECETTGTGNPAKGIYNTVSMEGDKTPDDNDACVPAETRPAFSVNKTTAEEPIVLTPDQTSVSVTYTVTLKNTGFIEGNSPEIYENPNEPAGFTISKVVANDVALTDPYLLPSVLLQPDEEKVFTVVITYDVNLGDIDWSTIGECQNEGIGDKTKGIFNSVGMVGDPDSGDNDACVPVVGEPGLTLEKKVNGYDADADAPVVVKAGSTLAITFVVTNTGTQPLTEVKVTDSVIPADQITAPAQKAAVDGTMVTFDGTLAPGETAVFTASIIAPEAGGHHVNVGVAQGTPPEDPNGGDTPPVESPEDEGHALVPSLKIIKKINGDDANTAPGVSVVAGSTMHITFDVINDGKVDLNDVKVTDSVITQGITCPSGNDTISRLAAGETVQCTAKLAAPEAGTMHHNVGKATGTPDEPSELPTPTPGEPTPPTPETPTVESPEDPAYANTPETPKPPTGLPRTGVGCDGLDSPGGLGLLLTALAALMLRRRN